MTVGLSLFLGACSPHRGTSIQCSGQSQDSAHAVQIALDTLSNRVSWTSVVARYSHDSLGFRVVTMPTPGTSVLDGMGIIRLDAECHVLSLVVTDSA